MTSPTYPPSHATFSHGDLVHKKSGSQWHGRICGWYSTANNPEGYVVESVYESGSAQLFPARALELKGNTVWQNFQDPAPPAPPPTPQRKRYPLPKRNALGHRTRISDSSLYDEVCVCCGATDAPGAIGLTKPCLHPHEWDREFYYLNDTPDQPL